MIVKPDNGKERLIATSAAGISSFLTPFMSSLINIALPAIGAELNLDALTLSWVATISLLSAGIFILPAGRVADLAGRRLVFLLGLVIYIITTVLAVMAHSAAVLIFARFFQGVAGALIFGTGVALLTERYPPESKGLALGINTAAVYTGLSLGPFLGGVLTAHFGWRAVFAVNLPFSIVALVFALLLKPDARAQNNPGGFDLTGAFIYAGAILSLIFGLTRLPQVYAVILIITGIMGLITFGLWELRVTLPLFPLALFTRNPGFTFANLAALFNYAATAGVGLLLSLYLQSIKGLSAQAAGIVLVSQPVVMAIFSPVTGRLSDRIAPRTLASLGMAVSTIGLFLFALLGRATPLSLITAGLVLLGAGFGLFSAPNTNAVMSAVSAENYGTASATLATMRLLGQMLSYGLVMMLVSLFIGNVALQPGLQNGLLKTIRTVFVMFGFICILGTVASLARGKGTTSRSNRTAP